MQKLSETIELYAKDEKVVATTIVTLAALILVGTHATALGILAFNIYAIYLTSKKGD